MTSRRQQDLLEIAIGKAATQTGGDTLACDQETRDPGPRNLAPRAERLRLYWPADVLGVGDGTVGLVDPAWAAAYDAGRAAFVRSQRTLMALNHPNIGRITEVVDATGEGPDVAWSGTIGPARGLTLADWLGAGAPVRPAALAGLAADLAAGLEASHAAGVLHLDLAPETIGLGRDRAALFDFAGDRRPFIPLVKRTDRLFRPGFSAFETKDATETVPLGPAADIYGLSAVLYRMIAGRMPPEWFAWTDEMRLSALSAARAYPATLIQAIERGLSRMPGERFASVTDWAATANLALDVAPDRPWFDWPEDFAVPPSPPAPVDPLALAPPRSPVDPGGEVEPLGALKSGPWSDSAGTKTANAADVFKPSPEVPTTRTPIPRGAAPTRRRGAWVLGLSALGLLAILGLGALFVGGPSDPVTTDKAATTRPEAMPSAPRGCAWHRSDGATDLTLSCGRGDAARRVDAGDLRPGDTAAAAAGDAAAMTRLGGFYLGTTLGRDTDLGQDWLSRAATAGSGAAMLALASWHERQARADGIADVDAEASLRQALRWFQMAAPNAVDGASDVANIPARPIDITIDQRNRAEAGVERISARLTRHQDAAFNGCWRSAGGDVTADIAIADDRFTLSIEGAEPAGGDVALPREDGRLVVTLDEPALMQGQRYLFTREGPALIEHRLDARSSTARWDACPVG
ncbi:hypothetical protein BH10PSE2_BH10PSE2_11800 [soil metagenome]